MRTDIKVSGVIVLYNPPKNVIHNISSYIDEVETLYCIDNSDVVDEAIKEKIEKNMKCKYVTMNGNKGLSAALNIASKMAVEDGFEYLLTMDQDTVFEGNAVRDMKEYCAISGEEYSIICPNIKIIEIDDTNGDRAFLNEILHSVDNCEPIWVITSGSLMKLEDYVTVCGFDENLFVGHIDIDYGYKLYVNNKKILRLGNSYMYQQFGNAKPKKFLWKTVYPTYDKSVRTYYIFRNESYLRKKWGRDYKKISINMLKYALMILLYENNKLEKFTMALQGLRDAKNEKMGKFEI